MRLSSKRGFSLITTVVVCVLETLSTFGLQNETVSHVGASENFPPSYDLKNTIINKRNSSIVNIPYDESKTKAISIIANNTIDNEISAVKKRTKKNKRRRTKKDKRKRKGITGITITTETPLVQPDGSKLETTTLIGAKRKRKKKLNRRKNRKNKRKQKLENSNILEVTTAKGVIFRTNSDSNSTIYELIRKLNENPEDNFDEFRINHINKTIYRTKANAPNVANLVAHAPPFSQYPIHLNDNITLHVNVGNGTNNAKRNNRCRKNKGGCAHFCRPKGRIKCSCLEGFALAQNQKNCLDIDECKVNNGGCEIKCLNTVGSFDCRCRKGLRLADDLKSCNDINECLLRNGHGPCQDTCENTHGSYKCSCAGLNGTMLGEDGHTCVDLNECSIDNGGCSHICINTLGRAFCTCPDGMELSTDWKTCQDINECEEEAVNQTCKNGCINTSGSYRCVDISEYQSDQAQNNVACKPLFPPSQGFISCSRDGAPHTYTKKGRKRTVNSPGTICKLVCPIGYRPSGQFYLTCRLSGKWEGKSEAKCIPVAPPTLECPSTRSFTTDNGSKTAVVKFPPPVTNINWKYVKSYPSWAKNLTGTLSEGRYDIDFIVRDPSTKLSTTCSFRIIVEN